MSVDAWVLHLGDDVAVAVGYQEMRHLLEYPSCYPIPTSPSHCSVTLLWEGQVLPVVNLLAWLRDTPMDPIPALVGIVQYRIHGPVIAAALVLERPPERIQVSNTQACELPPGPWRCIAHACFHHHEQPVPVLDLARIFHSPWPGSLVTTTGVAHPVQEHFPIVE